MWEIKKMNFFMTRKDSEFLLPPTFPILNKSFQGVLIKCETHIMFIDWMELLSCLRFF